MRDDKSPKKDIPKHRPELKLVKKRLAESPDGKRKETTKAEVDPAAEKFLEFARNHAKRVAKIMAMMGLKPSADPLTTQQMMRMTEEELDSLEERISRELNDAPKES